MARYYYGTVPALAWILNHYFYRQEHYAFLAEAFHPLRSNPKSSNPYLIYGDLMWAWSYTDEFDKYVSQSRYGLARGALARRNAGITDPALTRRLRRICAGVPVTFFYPVVYRVEVGVITPARRNVAGSGALGSREIVVHDLREHEFDLLFADDRSD